MIRLWLLECKGSEQGHHHADSQEGYRPCEEGHPSEGGRSGHDHPEALAASLADSHVVSKKQAAAVLGDFVTLTTRHLKKGTKIRLTGLGVLQVRKRAARMGGTQRPAKRSESRPARRSRSGQPRNSRRRCRATQNGCSDCRGFFSIASSYLRAQGNHYDR
jgi:nucleoid DNA-binding protein